ncbi:MAG: proteasome accessory factor PafA2 [Bifidobacteriaceae bacterium]|nr:proteasome accessory factor PafA2 [Bifidobacteriaceae bacterium]
MSYSLSPATPPASLRFFAPAPGAGGSARAPDPQPGGGLVCGLETEYGVLGASRNPVELSNWVVAAYKQTQGDRVAPWDYGGEDPLADARGFHLDRAAAHPSLLTDGLGGIGGGSSPMPATRPMPSAPPVRTGPGAALLANGARLYVDHAHPEYATPECGSAREAALWDKAGERVMAAAARALAAEGRPVSLYKNNTDGQGASYGTHENYLLPRSLDWGQLVAGVTPFLVTRQLFAGSGRVGLGPRSQEPGLQLSQRADFVEAEVGLETTFNRPIVNTRDEPHADPARWRRLHVIVGDATVLEVATYLRVGATGLTLAALADADPAAAARFADSVALANPVAAFRQVSRDLALKEKLELRTGGHATALEIQRRYLDFCGRDKKGQALSVSPAQAADLLERWAVVLDGLAEGPEVVARQVEWAAKLQVLDALRARRGVGWEAPALRAADLKWTDVDPAVSLAARLEAAGAVDRLFAEEEIAWAAGHPPESTRAYLKGETLRRHPEWVASAGWDRLTLRWDGGEAAIPLPDPRQGSRAAAQTALDQAESAQDLAHALAPAPAPNPDAAR